MGQWMRTYFEPYLPKRLRRTLGNRQLWAQMEHYILQSSKRDPYTSGVLCPFYA